MARSRITINGITSSYVEVPINQAVSITNDGQGDETSIQWYSFTGSQPSGTFDGLTSAAGATTGITPTKIGSYLIQNVVDTDLSSSAIIAVKHEATTLRAPAAGETTEESGSYGWAQATQKLFDVVDEKYRDPGFVIGSAGEDVEVGHLVRPSGTLTLSDGLASEHELIVFSGIGGEATGSFQSSLYLVDSPLTGTHTTVTSGTLFKARLFGHYGPLTGSAVVGDFVWPRSDGVISLSLDSVDRKIGTVTTAGGGNYWVHFDGTSDFRPDVASVDPLTLAVLDPSEVLIQPQCSSSNNFSLTMNSAVDTLLNPSGTAAGEIINIQLIQDSTGYRTLDFDTAYKFDGGGTHPENWAWSPDESTNLRCFVVSATNGVATEMNVISNMSGTFRTFNVKNFGARGDGVANDTLAIKACIDAADGGNFGDIYFPPGTYYVTGSLVLTGSYNRVRGAGRGVTTIDFRPPSHSPDYTPCIKLDTKDGAVTSQVHDSSIEDIRILGSTVNSGTLQTAVEVVNKTDCWLKNVYVQNWYGASASIGFLIRGHEALRAYNCFALADRPLVCSTGTIDSHGTDHFHFTDCQWIVTPEREQPCVEIEDGTAVSAMTFDGSQVMARGTHGLYWRHTSTVGGNQINVKLEGIRSEQATNDTGHTVYIEVPGLVRDLTIDNCRFDSNRGGLFVSGAYGISIRDTTFSAATGSVIVVQDSQRLEARNVDWGTVGTANLVGLQKVYGEFQQNSLILPQFGLWVTASIAEHNVRTTRDLRVERRLRFDSVESGAGNITTSQTSPTILAVTDLSTARNVTIGSTQIQYSGTMWIVKDETGDCSPTNYIDIIPGSGQIDGQASHRITIPYGAASFYTDGTNLYTISTTGSGDVATSVWGVYNVKDYGAVGDNSTDDTTAIQNCIDAAGSAAKIFFPSGSYVVTDTLSITNSNVFIEGTGRRGTQISFRPSGSSGVARCFYIEGNWNSVKNMALISNQPSSLFQEKHGFWVINSDDFIMEDVYFRSWVGVSSSVGIFFSNCDRLSVGKLHMDNVDRCLVFGTGSSDAFDGAHFYDLYLYGANQNTTGSLIEVQDQVEWFNVRFDGYQRWIQGNHGFYWAGESGGNNSYNVKFSNVRCSNGLNSNAYSFYVDNGSQTRQFQIENSQLLTGRNGLLLRNGSEFSLKHVVVNAGAVTSIDVNSSIADLNLQGFRPQAVSTVSVGMTRRWGAFHANASQPLESDALYTGNATLYDYYLKEVYVRDRFRLNRVASGAGNITTSRNGTILAVTDTSSPRNVTINSSDMQANGTGSVFFVKDESGGAGSNNITVSAGTGTIDGAATITINQDYGFVQMYTTEFNLHIIAKSGTDR